MRSSNYAPEKRAIPVEISLANGSALTGKIWVAADKSVTDTLNAPQAFIEFSPYGEERIQLVAKAQIITLSTSDVPKAVPLFERRGVVDPDDPYYILGIAAGSPWHAVREAYVQLAKAYHPDRFAGVVLPNEVSDYMGARARRINTAYGLLENALRSKASSIGSQGNRAAS